MDAIEYLKPTTADPSCDDAFYRVLAYGRCLEHLEAKTESSEKMWLTIRLALQDAYEYHRARDYEKLYIQLFEEDI